MTRKFARGSGVANDGMSGGVVQSGRQSDSNAGRDANVLQHMQDSVLDSGEAIVWQGRPDPWRVMFLDKLQPAYGGFFVVFTTVWVVSAWSAFGIDRSNLDGIGIIFLLVPLYFYVIGLWMLSTPIRNMRKARRTYYAVTSRRVIILRWGARIRINDYTPTTISDYEQTSRGEGRGDIRLRKTPMGAGFFFGLSGSLSCGLWGTNDMQGAASAIAALPDGYKT